MIKVRTTRQLALAFITTALLAACGGGSEPFTVKSSGVFKGSTGTGRAVTAVVLDDGAYYLVYSVAGNATKVGGAVQGTGTLADTSFTSTSGRTYDLERLNAASVTATVSATVVPGSVFNGTVDPETATATTFETTLSGDAGQAASLDVLAGAYPGQVEFALGTRDAVFNVTPAGQVASEINGCQITGAVGPRTDVNAYDLTITFGGAPCVLPNLSFSGIAYYDTAAGRLTAFVRNAAISRGVSFSGSRS